MGGFEGTGNLIVPRCLETRLLPGATNAGVPHQKTISDLVREMAVGSDPGVDIQDHREVPRVIRTREREQVGDVGDGMVDRHRPIDMVTRHQYAERRTGPDEQCGQA